jgi:hypothetical protein
MILKKKTDLLFYFFLIFSLFFGFYFGFFNKLFVSGASSFFSDWSYIVRGLECKKLGFNIFSENNCQRVNYGFPLFFLPYYIQLKIFYTYYIPIFLVAIFCFAVFKIIDTKSNDLIKNILIILIIFNPSSLLLFERFNIDIILFLIIILIAYNKKIFIDYILIFFSFLLKFYPLVFILKVFILENKKNKIYLPLLFILFCFSIYFLYFSSINSNIGHSKAGYHYLFSIKALPKFFHYYFNINYIFINLINYTLTFFLIFRIHKLLIQKKFLSLSVYPNSFNTKLFYLSANTLIVCYLVFSNYYYREVFLIGIVPYVLYMKLLDNNNEFFSLFLKIIIIRYIFLFFYAFVLTQYTFYHLDSVRIFNIDFLIVFILKGIFDYILFLFIVFPLLIMNFNVLKKYIN